MAECIDYDNFNWFDDNLAQNTLKNIAEEQAKKYGLSAKYIPANVSGTTADSLFGENREKIFDEAIDVKLYFDTYENYNGDGDTFNQFGITFDDELIVFIDYNQYQSLDSAMSEGDLVYFATIDAIFEISYVDPEVPFFLMGTQTAYKLKLKKYRQNLTDEFDESGINNADITDIINKKSDATNTNDDYEDKANNITDGDDDEGGSLFGDW